MFMIRKKTEKSSCKSAEGSVIPDTGIADFEDGLWIGDQLKI